MNPIARLGDKHICGNPKHPPNAIVSGGSGMVDGKPIARLGDSCGCGAIIVKGSSESTCDGQPVAYQGSATQCGPYTGVIASGSPSAKVKP